MANKDLVTLMIDTARGTCTEFSKDKASDMIRQELISMIGTDKPDFKALRRNKVEVFEILEEALTELVHEGIENQFDQFAEVRNLNWGDTNVFTVEDQSLFNVAVIADGTGNLRRQRIDKGEFTVSAETRGVKIYEEFNRLLAGRVDWAGMVQRVAKSYNLELATRIYDAIYNSFSDLTATYAISSAYSESTLTELVSHVEAATNADVTVYGTKKALGKVTPSAGLISDNMRDQRNQIGYYATVNGVDLREIKQAHKAGTNDFAINDNFLLVVPNLDDKMVKIVNEGEAIIQDNVGGVSADMSQEYLFTLKSGIAVVPSAKYGIYRLA